MEQMNALVAGAIEYIGGCLIPALLESGSHARIMARKIDNLGARTLANHLQVERIQADVFDLLFLRWAFAG